MLRKIVKIGVLLLILNALYQTVPVFWRYQRFKMALDDLAIAAKGKTDGVIVDDVLDLRRCPAGPARGCPKCGWTAGT